MRISSKEHVKMKYRSARCRHRAGDYSIVFQRKDITYVITAGSKTEAGAWRKAERAIYGN